MNPVPRPAIVNIAVTTPSPLRPPGIDASNHVYHPVSLRVGRVLGVVTDELLWERGG